MADQQEAWRRGGQAQELKQYPGSSSADKAFTELRATVFKITNDVYKMRQMVSQIGTQKDTRKFRTEIHAYDARVQQAVARAKEQSAYLQQIRESLSPERARSWQRVTEDLMQRLEEYKEVVQWRKRKEADNMPIEIETSSSKKLQQEEETPLIGTSSQAQLQQQVLLEHQIDYQEAIIEENEQAIVDIVASINEVHQITQDIGVLVSDQGAMLTDLEANIGSMAKRTDAALGEIESAEQAQKKQRNIWCWVFVFVAIVFSVVVVALLLAK